MQPIINFIYDEKAYAQIVDASRSTGIVFVANGRNIMKSANTPDIIIASVIQGLIAINLLHGIGIDFE